MAELNKEFIVNLQGKDFVTYNGLVDLAHQLELKSITTEIIQFPTDENNNQCIVKAVATTFNEMTFEGYGDADPTNVNRMIAKHLIRMAETRAKARALRDLTNVGMTAFEELGEQEDDTPQKGPSTPQKPSNGKGISEAQIKRLYAIGYSAALDANTIKEQVKTKFKKEVADLTRVEYDAVIAGYEKLKESRGK